MQISKQFYLCKLLNILSIQGAVLTLESNPFFGVTPQTDSQPSRASQNMLLRTGTSHFNFAAHKI